MNKKKGKRISQRPPGETELAAWWQRFYERGAPTSLLMLAVFVLVSAAVLCLDPLQPLTSTGGRWLFLASLLQGAALLGLLALALGCYVAAYEPRLVSNHRRGASLLLLLWLAIAAMRVVEVQGWSPFLMIAPVLALVIMLCIGYSQRFALGIGAFAAIMSLVLLRRENLGLFLSMCTAMGVVVLLLKEVDSRSKLIRVCALAAVVGAAMVWAAGVWLNEPLSEVLWDSLWAGGAILAVGFLMQGFLPLVERLFGTATVMTLRDYAEANRPLLKRLAVAAPGTFNHSWQIGMLAEAAADAIGANGLLCRVGSYYHDIGKINKPRYFVENQAENFNQHRELSPTMSRMIIIGHVKDGLELAQEYRLPKVIQQFIATHHGTTLVEYFYHEASRKGAEMGHSVAEADFRYPGPKPQSKEAAIAMVADAVEGATRAMNDPTPIRIETVVHELAMKRLQDGQFDDCDLTMRELKRIEASLVKSLCGMYHGRIAYPKTETPESGARQARPAKNEADESEPARQTP